MKKGLIILVVLLLCTTMIFAQNTTTEKANEEIDKAMTQLPDSVWIMLNEYYSEIMEEAKEQEITHSEGYRVHVLSPEKVTGLDLTVESLDDLVDKDSVSYWLYYLKKDERSLVLVTMAQGEQRAYMEKAGGLAGCYVETRALLNSFVSDERIRIYEFGFGQYVMVAEINGQRYAVPFDRSKHILKEYADVTNYEQLPTEKEFLEAMIAENEAIAEMHRKYIEEHGKDATIYGSYQIRPAAHIYEK